MELTSPEENGQLVYQAALYGNADLLGDLLGSSSRQPDSWKDSHGKTAVHVAAANGHHASLQLLLSAGGNENDIYDHPSCRDGIIPRLSVFFQPNVIVPADSGRSIGLPCSSLPWRDTRRL